MRLPALSDARDTKFDCILYPLRRLTLPYSLIVTLIRNAKKLLHSAMQQLHFKHSLQ